MKPFRMHRGILVPLDRAHVDTDQIIPKQFLKSIQRTGFGENLFFDWRYLANGKPNPDFELNKPAYQGASILVARNNFGCGSSREHAVWAIEQYGIRAIMAPSKVTADSKIPAFADIFRSNCSKNSVLTIELKEEEIEEIFQMVMRKPGLEASVDLEKQRVTLHLDEEISFHFDVDPAVKERLLNGLDDIGLALREAEAIKVFEAKHQTQLFR